MKIVITILNASNAKQFVSLVPCLYKEEDFLSRGIMVSAQIADNEPIPYRLFAESISVQPIPAKVMGSSNNRQVNFFALNGLTGGESPLEPTLTKKGNARRRINKAFGDWDYRDKWNPEKWNVADTHEAFVMDYLNRIEVCVKPYRTFSLEIERLEKIKIGNPLERDQLYELTKEKKV